ncbi:MAG: secretin N-terminal domain-containing protein, partial [Planctomycetota bacterium]|nr:secretin N-terminal domain-containing protein [Planctomycetota bacterium]
CIFPLGELEPEEAVEELAPLNLLKSPDIFTKTNQLLLTDTAGKLQLAKKVLGAFKPETLDNGTVVKSFRLNHVDAEDFLMVARPHLGLAVGEMIGIDVSISADVLGNSIFVTGIEDKVKLIEGLIREVDVEEKKLKNQIDILQSHPVNGGNVEMVYNVLQTMLSGDDIRLSMDQTAKAIVAFAPASTQKIIADTVLQMQASEAEFVVISLKHIDPYFVIALLEDILELEDSAFETPYDFDYDRGGRDREDWGRRRREDPKPKDLPPKINADPGSMKLFVLGKKNQIQQIRKIVEELDVPTTPIEIDGSFQAIPLKGSRAVSAIEMAARFWKGTNSIIFYPPDPKVKEEVKERVIAEESSEPKKGTSSPKPLGTGRILSQKINTEEPPIQIQITERGILLQCDDEKALKQFVEILRTVIGPTDSVTSAPVVYYLKYAKPNDALPMLAELLDGGVTAKEAESGTLVNGVVSNTSGSFFGSLILSRDGALTLTFDTMTVVADTRLNRLIVQGTVDELELIETYLKIIDKEDSITSIETLGTSHVIALDNVDANEVAATLREAFFGQVMGTPTTSQNRKSGQPNSSSQNRDSRKDNSNEQRDEKDRDNNGGSKNSSSKKANSSPQTNTPKMTIAVHERTNSLIVTAPQALFQKVEQLAKLIDARSVQKVEIIKVRRPLANDLRQILSENAVFSGTNSSNDSDKRRSTSRSGSENPRTQSRNR